MEGWCIMSNLVAQHERKRLEEHTKRLKEKLRELFQIGDIAEDLDFGIYRIVHQKRKDVEEFIDTTIGRTVDEAFGTYTDDARAGIVTEREALEHTIREEIDETALGADGILHQYLNTKRARDLNDRWKQLHIDESRATMSDQHKAEIFAHVTEFFSRYYKDGDFLSLPRYSKRKMYAIPYNGEEVVLHWANKDQYYIKTDLWLNNYAFDAGVYKVVFEVCRADNSVNTANDKELVFVLARGDDAIAFDQAANVLIIRFFRTKRNADEMAEFLPEGANREKPSKEHLRETIVKETLPKITDDGIKALLNRRAYPERPDNLTTIFQKHVNQFTTENTSDFFIHKDLRGFLTRELDFYLKNEVINLDDLGTDREMSPDDLKQYMTRARIIKQICTRIIDFLAQLEEFQKMLFEKKKFVLATDYCMTLDYVPEEFYDGILGNEKQLTEWKALFGAGEEEQATLGTTARGITREYLQTHPYLVLDTKFFDVSFKEKLLVKLKRPDGTPVQDLDAETGGLMFHSENWQALNLLQEKYLEKVQCTYIDPPYNTGNKEFQYKDNYQHSNWLSMMADRIAKNHNLIANDGVFFSSIDDNEAFRYQILLQSLFTPENFLSSLVWQKRYAPPPDTKDFGYVHELIHAFRKSAQFQRNLLPLTEDQRSRYSNPDNDPRGPWMSDNYTCRYTADERPNLYYTVTNPHTGQIIWPNRSRVWAYSPEEHERNVRENRIWWGVHGENSTPRRKRYLNEIQQGMMPTTILFYEDVGHTDEAAKEIRNFFPMIKYTAKPTRLLKQIFRIGTKSDNLILDYFAGSGTTAHAVLSMNKDDSGKRKYILVEMGDYFHTMMKPRIEKIIFASEWRDGKPIAGSTGQSHIFKYQTLEQYEDALDNIVFRERDGTVTRTLFGFSDYMLHYMLGFETQGSPCRLNTDALKKPFDYTLRIRRRRLDPDHLKCSAHDEGSNTWWDVKVDLVETFNYLLGLHVLRVTAYDANGLHYRVVYGRTQDNGTVTVVWRNSPEGESALTADERFINETIKHEFPASTFYINGLFFVKGAEHIEPKFRELMGA